MLDRVTITGADDSTDPLEMLDLALAYPWLEFGILVSASREGSPRYSSRSWQQTLLKSAHRMNLSMHVCGKWAREIFVGAVAWGDLPPIKTEVERIQINGNPSDITYPAFPPIANGIQLIVQYPRALKYLTACQEQHLNCVPLFDESGGEGRIWREWTDLPLDYVGYAGGIGPDNVADAVKQVSEMRSGPFWIDMEGRVRDEKDRLDMHKVGRVLDICEGIFNRPAFDEMLASAERKLIVAEMERRDRERGIITPKEPPHCYYCFEGCPRCQPTGPLVRH